jgi:putative oxidoreductase
MNRFLHLSFLPRNIDPALLLLRVWMGFTLFAQHGVEKITHFSQMAAHFPDPLHIGPAPSLACALLSDAVCSLLVAVGLWTRLASLIVVINVSVAFSLVHRFSMSGPHSGELAFLYLGAFLTTLLAGAGRYSVDFGLLKAL